MERNITIGLIIAFILTIAGAFIMYKSDDGGAGFLLDFLKNHTENITNSTNSTINETINQTENITDNSTISFDASAVYDNATNAVLISISASKENITVDRIDVMTSYDDFNYTTAKTLENTILPTVVEVPANENATMYYFVVVNYNGTGHRVPAEGAYNVSLNETAS